jgi:regulator of sigma E protease
MDAILNFLPYIGWVLLAIMILVFIHELGHFLFAKLFKMRVDKFSVGFPPKVIGATVGETEYVLGLTPLGGYVKIAGMVDESMDTDELAQEPQPWEFRSKPVWQRILVITGGVLFNIILAAVIFIGLKATYGEAYDPAVGAVIVDESSVAAEMGIRTGDVIAAVNGKPVDVLEGLSGMEELLMADPLIIDVQRDGQPVRLEGPRDIMTRLNKSGGSFGIDFDAAIVGYVGDDTPAEEAGLKPGDRILGIGDSTITFFQQITPALQATTGDAFNLRIMRPDTLTSAPSPSAVRLPDSLQTVGGTIYDLQVARSSEGDGPVVLGINQFVRLKDYTLIEAVGSGVADTWLNTRMVASSLKRIFVGQDDFRENIGGPVMIARVTREAADMGAPYFWQIVAMLSITLAIINILPIPALDGGHLVFLIYEGIVRREPSLKIRMALQQIGMVILLAFMVFVIFNDILKL